MIKLPINLEELDIIIKVLKNSHKKTLYSKLWTYKMNYLNGDYE
jgi:hypothetical protein